MSWNWPAPHRHKNVNFEPLLASFLGSCPSQLVRRCWAPCMKAYNSMAAIQFSNYSRNAILSLKCTSNAHWDSCVGGPLGSWHWNIAGKTHERSILLLPHASCSWQLFGTFRREVTSDLNILLISLRCGCGWRLSCILHMLWMAVRRSALLSDFLETQNWRAKDTALPTL